MFLKLILIKLSTLILCTKWNKNINLLHEKENINNWIINRVLYLDEFLQIYNILMV